MEQQPGKVVITECDHGSIEEEKKEFGRIGAELIFAQVKGEQELIRVCKDADGLLIQYSLLTREVLQQLPKCKVIARYGVGVDSIDLKAATNLGIIVANVPDYCVDEVADQAVSMSAIEDHAFALNRTHQQAQRSLGLRDLRCML